MRTFYALVVTQALSLIGSRMTNVGVGLWVFSRTGETTPLLLAAFFLELPATLGGAAAGVLVDRWPRRRVLMLADAGQAVGSALLLASFLTGAFELWHLYAVATLSGCFAAFQQPAEDASITMLVPEPQRDRANGIRQLAFPLAGTVAPALAGLLFAAGGIALVIGIDLLTFVIAIAVVSRMRIPDPERAPAAAGSFGVEALAGLHFLLARRPLLALVLYSAAMNFLLNGPLELSLPYLLRRTGSEAMTGVLLAAMSLGAFAGALLVSFAGGRRTSGRARPRVHLFLLSLLVAGAMFLTFGVVETPGLLGASLFLLMLPLPVQNALLMSILQSKTPAGLQGRVFGIVAQFGFIGATASFVSIGPLVDRVLEPLVATPSWRLVEGLVGSAPGAGMGLVLLVTGVVMIVATASVAASRSIRELERRLPDAA